MYSAEEVTNEPLANDINRGPVSVIHRQIQEGTPWALARRTDPARCGLHPLICSTLATPIATAIMSG
jgi:hypothetical protein